MATNRNAAAQKSGELELITSNDKSCRSSLLHLPLLALVEVDIIDCFFTVAINQSNDGAT